jgi:hypothetical protein
MADEIEIRTATAEERRQGLDCLRCGMLVSSPQIWTLRTGGSSGGLTALLGGLAELGEGTIDGEVTPCAACGNHALRCSARRR